MKRLILRILLVLIVLVLLGGVWVWRQSRKAPEWYMPADPTDAAVVELAEKVEYGLVETFHKLRPDGEPWTVRIREAQINAWLAARMPEWIAHDETLAWPEDLGVPQVHIGPDGLDLAVALGSDNAARVVATRLAPRIADGRIHLEMERVGVGRVAVPGAPATKLIEIIERFAPGGVIDAPVAQQLVGLLRPGDGADTAGAARFELADGRHVELTAITLSDGALDLTSQTFVAEPTE